MASGRGLPAMFVKDVLDKHPEVEDGRPLYLYFVEVESFIHE